MKIIIIKFIYHTYRCLRFIEDKFKSSQNVYYNDMYVLNIDI